VSKRWVGTSGTGSRAAGAVSGHRPYPPAYALGVFAGTGGNREFRPPPQVLFSQAFIIWLANILTFAAWYWEIDNGGPERRKTNTSYQSEDFLFPQMSQDQGDSVNWSPGLLDYLFLAFNQSTAFSPTDTAVLSRRAKILTISQTSISLLILVVLAARAVS
jgi:hypothetical protein